EVYNAIAMAVNEEIDEKLFFGCIPDIASGDVTNEEFVDGQPCDIHLILKLSIVVVVVQLEHRVQCSGNVASRERVEDVEVDLAQRQHEFLFRVAGDHPIQQDELSVVAQQELINLHVLATYGDHVVRIKRPVLLENLNGRWQKMQLRAVAHKLQVSAKAHVIRLILLISVKAEKYFVFVPHGLRQEVTRAQSAGEVL